MQNVKEKAPMMHKSVAADAEMDMSRIHKGETKDQKVDRKSN